MRLGVNNNNEIIEYGDNISENLNVIEVEDDTFTNQDPTLFKIIVGENWQEITPRVKVQAWQKGLSIAEGQIIAYEGGLYRATQAHTSKGKEDFTPGGNAPVLFEDTAPGKDGEKKYGRSPLHN